jgi:1,2-diacylglycerol 3-beta-glucosyltransferase
MMSILTQLLLIGEVIAMIALIPFVLFILLVLICAILARFKERISRTVSSASTCRVLFVVPAHNEEMCLQKTIDSLKNAISTFGMGQILVLADNCSDQTASIARKSGVFLYERFNLGLRGKGHALEECFRHVLQSSDHAEITHVCVVDADSIVNAEYLIELAATIASGVDWIQTDDAVANVGDHWRTKLMAWGFGLFNGVWQMGCAKLGIGASLRGNGMAFSRNGLLRLPWKATGLAEDLEMSWRVKLNGEFIAYCRRARALAEMPTQLNSSASQRQRWEHGRLHLKKTIPIQILQSRLPIIHKLLLLLELRMPAITLFGGSLLALFVIALFLATTIADSRLNAVVMDVSSFGLIILTLYGLSPFVLVPTPLIALTGIFGLPQFVIWRAFQALKSVPKVWIRTEREVRSKDD